MRLDKESASLRAKSYRGDIQFTKIAALKKIIDKEINLFDKSVCIITNLQNGIIIQSITKAFDTNLVYRIQKTIAEITQSIQTKGFSWKDFHIVEYGSDVLCYSIENLKKLQPELLYVYFFGNIK